MYIFTIDFIDMDSYLQLLVVVLLQNEKPFVIRSNLPHLQCK